ncbi:MAG: hypothetical protein COT00_01875, partial [Candidatus Omnitrophica bacterium CG07_land_8_20_14_0_80_50_8]
MEKQMDNSELMVTEVKPFKSRWPLWVKIISIIIIFNFASREIVFAADPSGFLQREKQKDSKFLPRYLLEQQQKHEYFIQGQQDRYDLANSTIDDFMRRLRKKKPFLDDERRRGGGPPGDKLQYTLSDPNEDGTPTTLDVYEYAGDKLLKIVKYDVTGVDISQYIQNVKDIEGKDGEKFKGGYVDLKKVSLTDEMILEESYFEGDGTDSHLAYVLSGFEDGTNEPTEMSVYKYSDGVLQKIETFNIEGLTGDFKDAAYRNSLTEDHLTSLSVFTGEKGKEKISYTLSDYDDENNPSTLTYYEYDGDTLKSQNSYDISDIAQFVKDNAFNFKDQDLRSILVAEKLKTLSIKELLGLLEQSGLLNGSAESILSQLSGKELLDDLSGKDLLTLLYSKGFISEDADKTISKLSMQDAFDALSGDELLSFLIRQGYIDENQTLKKDDGSLDVEATMAALKEKLTAAGLDLAKAKNDDLLTALESNSLLTKSAADIKGEVKIEDLLSALSASELLEFLASSNVNLLVGNPDTIYS